MSGWEVVKRKKAGADSSKKLTKAEKKNVNNMPKLEDIAPIQESQTMFDAFIEKDKKKNEGKANGTVGKTKNNKEQQQQKKKHPDKKKNQPKAVPLEDAIKSLDAEEMKNRFASGEARFPETPMFWLKDLASFMNLKLDVELTDPVFFSKPTNYPVSLLSQEISDLLHMVFNKCPTKILEEFFEFCLISMVYDSLKGLNTMGYRICLQCLARGKPLTAVSAISRAIELRNAHQNRPNVCLSVLWALGQAGFKNLEIGVKVWAEVMFPMLGTKAYSKYVVEYLETFLGCHKPKKLNKSLLSVKDLFPILDHVHSHSSGGLPGNLQKQLLALYPRLKVLSYGPDPPSILRNYFPSYLRRLEPGCSAAMQSEVLSSLVECLVVDKLSYSVWRQFYTKHLIQSSILITHLHDQWNHLPSTFPRKLLHETLCAFQVTNEELKGQSRGTPEIDSCVTACRALINKMNAQSFPWMKLLLSLMVTISAILAYDVQQHGSFRSSKTGELMKNVGILAVCEQAWSKITVYSLKAIEWLEVNVPIFKSWVYQNYGPHLKLFWERLFSLCVYLWDSTLFIRSWANTNIPPILKQVNDMLPGYAQMVSNVLDNISSSVFTFASTAFKFTEVYFYGAIEWLHKNVFTGSLSAENLQKFAGNAVNTFQQYTMTTYNWISNSIAAVYAGR